MNDQTRFFLKKRFGEYYAEHPVPVPAGFPQREWGFLFYEEAPDRSRPMQMHRHKAFNSAAELNDYLKSMAPQHAYHSAAYYQYPQAPTMIEKNWLGADLIFDLDADHLPNSPKSYSGMVEMVKKEFIRLIDEFLIDDLGFSEKNLEIVFSGGRGYHVHVLDARVRALKSPERREIVDYVLGTGLDSDRIFTNSQMIVEGSKGLKTESISYIKGFESSRHGYGWNRRVARYIAGKLADLGRLDDKEAKKELKKYEVDGKQASALLAIARDPVQLSKIQEEGRLEIKGDLKAFFKRMLDGTIDQFKVDLAGKTDEPVTADIKRLIRLPGSIHGGSSFGVVPLNRKQLETFNPLEDAIIFTESPVRVLVTKPQEVEIKGKIWRVSEGVGRLPENVAMYLMCRGSAEYEP